MKIKIQNILYILYYLQSEVFIEVNCGPRYTRNSLLYSRRRNVRNTNFRQISQLSQFMQEQYYFLTNLTSTINRAIRKMGYDYFKVRDFISYNVLLIEGKALNLSTLSCNWQYINVTNNENNKLIDAVLTTRDFLITFEVKKRFRYGALGNLGILTILLPQVNFNMKLIIAGLTKDGTYIPILDKLYLSIVGDEEIHYTLIPKEADRFNTLIYSKMRHVVKLKAKKHLYSNIIPFLETLMRQLMEEILTGEHEPLPKMTVHKSDEGTGVMLGYNVNEKNIEETFYLTEIVKPENFREKPIPKIADKVSTEMYDKRSDDIY